MPGRVWAMACYPQVMSPTLPELDPKMLADFCTRHHIRRLAFFGSCAQEQAGPDSDLDVLVEFEPGHVPGFAFIAIQQELTEMTGHQVDLHTPASLSRYFRDQVLEQALDQYVA